MVIYPSDTKAVLLADIVPILKKYGVTLQAESKAKIEDLVPRYAKEYIYARIVGREDAILILCGLDPSDIDYGGGGEWQDGTPVPDYHKFKAMFELGIHESALISVMGIGIADQYKHDEIRQWCTSNGVYWPIPDTKGFTPSITSHKQSSELTKMVNDLQAKLDAATIQIKDHEATAKFMREVTQERDSLSRQVTQLNMDKQHLVEQLVLATKQNKELSADLLTGKSRTFFLEMLGGLVSSILYVDIFKSGNISVGKVTMALEIVGLTPTPEKVSQYLKAAALKLEENNKDTAIKVYLAKLKQTENS